MAWTAPRTWVAAEVPSAATMNAHIRDNLSASLWQFAEVLTSQTTASVTYVDLATVGPAITTAVGGEVTVAVGCQAFNSTAGAHAIMSYVVRNSGDSADVIAVADDWMFDSVINTTASNILAAGQMSRQTATLVAGTTYIFRSKYRVTAGTGTFLRRWIMVLANGPA